MIFHLPTLLLGIGFVTIWLEIFLFRMPAGQTTPFALFFFVVVSIVLLRKQKWTWDWKVVLGSFLIGGIGLVASFYPPHLPAELDVLNYHYTLPRQHILRHDFAHIPWSTADLWLLPIQFALAPYWFVTAIPNKLPQFLFMVGLWGISYRLAGKGALLVLLALLGSHGLGIQYGTAMLDIPICYLFVAALHSLSKKQYALFGLELAFFVWSKSFMPIQMLLIAVALLVLRKMTLKHTKWFLVFSLFIASPFLVKSFYYTGTPLYPFGVGVIERERTPELKESAEALMNVRNQYGDGRSVKSFLFHFWRVAVPTKGVNNEFDYPLGLPYLLFVGPFFFYLYKSIRKRKVELLPCLVVLFWALWWMGSQQARWLYLPLTLMFIWVAQQKEVLKSKFFLLALVFSVGLNALSMVRSNKQDWGKSWAEVVAPVKDELALATTPLTDLSGPPTFFLRDRRKSSKFSQ